MSRKYSACIQSNNQTSDLLFSVWSLKCLTLTTYLKKNTDMDKRKYEIAFFFNVEINCLLCSVYYFQRYFCLNSQKFLKKHFLFQGK